MDSLTVQFIAGLIGKGKGITGNSALTRVLNGRTFNTSLRSTATAGTSGYASNGYDGERTLAGGANETLDLRAFTNLLNQTAQSLGKLRLFYVRHDEDSAASTISVGNSGVNALIILGMFGATAAALPPGGEIILAIPSAAGVTVDATHKDVKIVNDDATDAATFQIGWWGE